jgi:hypothetical protein
MPGTNVPAQMFDHELNPLKGWPSPYAVDKAAEIGSGVTGIQAGMVISLNGSGKWKRGAASADMPCFAFQNQSDFDVLSDVGNISGGVLMGLVAVGSYELESTEFAGTGFDFNIPLRARNTADADQGKLESTTLGSADLIVGVCSRAPAANENGKQVVRFWPVYLPKR